MTRGHKVCSIKMQSPRHVGVAKCSKSSKQTLARRVHKLPSRKEIVVSSPSHISISPQPGPSCPPLARIARRKCSWEKLHSLRHSQNFPSPSFFISANSCCASTFTTVALAVALAFVGNMQISLARGLKYSYASCKCI